LIGRVSSKFPEFPRNLLYLRFFAAALAAIVLGEIPFKFQLTMEN
jgi:hypothetical protein